MIIMAMYIITVKLCDIKYGTAGKLVPFSRKKVDFFHTLIKIPLTLQRMRAISSH
jgi:hypothetical protein